MSELCIISYIKDSCESLIQALVEEKINKYNQKKGNTPQEYETLLIKLEKDIRSHIQTEHQLKLYAESLKNVIEEIEKENQILKKKLNSDDNLIYNNNYNIDEKINYLKNEIEKNKKVLKSYESQNLKLAENERKLKERLINEYRAFNQKEIKYKQEIDSLKEKILKYEKKINMLIKDDYIYNQYFSNIKKEFDNNDKEINNKKKLNKNLIKNFSKIIFSNNNLIDNKKTIRTYRTNKNDNNSIKNHQNGPSLSASSSNEKIEKYLINKFARTQLQFKSKKNMKNSGNKKIQSPFNNSMVEKVNYDFYSNNKLQMNDSTFINIHSKQKKKYNRQKSAENNSKLILDKKKNDNLLKSILMSNNNSAFNINIKKDYIINSKVNNIKYKKVPSSTCSLKGRIKNIGKHYHGQGIHNNNFNGKIINNNINIYAHTLRQDNHNVYIKENNEKSLYNSLRGSSGNSSARDYHSSRYNYELLNFRKSSLGKKK